MHPHHWLEALFGSAARIRVLRVMALDPRRRWSIRELAKATGMSPNTISLAIESLDRQYVLATDSRGSKAQVWLQESSEVVGMIQRIFRIETRLEQRVREAIKKATPPDVDVLVFGSTARGDATQASDVDLMVVAPDFGSALDAGAGIEQAANRVMPARYAAVPMTRRDWKRRRSPFLDEVRRTARPIASGGSTG